MIIILTCDFRFSLLQMIVTGSTDATVRVWNPKTGECNHVFRGCVIILSHTSC